MKCTVYEMYLFNINDQYVNELYLTLFIARQFLFKILNVYEKVFI